jgi:predicted ATP-dependent endonuclease of OLD family
MRVGKVTLSNFRCFGPNPAVADLDDLTVLIGTNGTGKTAVLSALVRMFGIRPADRIIEFTDFYVPPGTDESTLTELDLYLEVLLHFPDSEGGEGTDGIPECFRHMAVEAPGVAPFCRIRLEANWTRSSTAGGEVEQSLYWIVSAEDNPPEASKLRVSAHDRANIAVIYVPASRDPGSQLRQASGSLLQPLLKAIEWADTTRASAMQAASEVRDAVRGEAAIQALENAISTEWNKLQSRPSLSNVQLQPLSSEFEGLVKQIEAVFSLPDAPVQQSQPLDRLSDGQRSLFYFSLVGARFELEQQLSAGILPELFDLDTAGLPVLTIFAIEEPENHLAPQYLSRILALLTHVASNRKAEVILTSQSPSVLGRVEPERVRHLQLDTTTGYSTICKILLPPADKGEAFKYVKEAVRAFPELYFAKLIVLGEGDSEEIVLPRAARATGQLLDQTFVSVVPLGGRHVNHFWRLLNDLRIPHVTLLDFDRERVGGGWSRIKYAIEQLVTYRAGLTLQSFGISQEQFDAMSTWSLEDQATLDGWVAGLEGYDVFFSSPLDLDFLLLEAFPAQYKAATTGTGPQIPDAGPALSKRLDAARIAVLKPEGGDGKTYTPAQRNLFIWYQYLFLGRGKPVTHMRALAALEDDVLAAGLPTVLQRLLARCLVLSDGQPATVAGT